MSHVPQPEALEEHPDALAALVDPVEAPEEIEVLGRGELEVDERLVGDVPDVPAIDRDVERAPVGTASPATMRRSVVFPAPFGPVTRRTPPASRRNEMSRRTVRGP